MLLFPEVTPAISAPGRRIIGALWWLSAALFINALIKRFVYRRHLTPDGEPTVPLLLQHVCTTLVYLSTAMIIMHFVYGQSITTVAATSGAVALVLGYSSQSMLDEIFAGLAPNVDAPFTKGVSYYSTMSGVT